MSDCNGVSISGRQVAVDIALSKSKYQEEQNGPAKTETGDERKDDDGSDGNDGSDDDEDDESGSSSTDDENDESEDEEAREKSLMSRMLGKVMADAEPRRRRIVNPLTRRRRTRTRNRRVMPEVNPRGKVVRASTPNRTMCKRMRASSFATFLSKRGSNSRRR